MLYGGSCCKPNCPTDGSRGGMTDGCGNTCGCKSGTTLYMGACCTPNCPTDYSRGGMDDTLRQDLRLPERLRPLRR